MKTLFFLLLGCCFFQISRVKSKVQSMIQVQTKELPNHQRGIIEVITAKQTDSSFNTLTPDNKQTLLSDADINKRSLFSIMISIYSL